MIHYWSGCTTGLALRQQILASFLKQAHPAVGLEASPPPPPLDL